MPENETCPVCGEEEFQENNDDGVIIHTFPCGLETCGEERVYSCANAHEIAVKLIELIEYNSDPGSRDWEGYVEVSDVERIRKEARNV